MKYKDLKMGDFYTSSYEDDGEDVYVKTEIKIRLNFDDLEVKKCNICKVCTDSILRFKVLSIKKLKKCSCLRYEKNLA